ncbi:DeoR family transcriptional regulator [Mycolicibacterium mageritense DSM 44476 = CIP 104973]|uniref:DeoR family transcriptional regulator n=1 Tax=Mycolicibacterium mageritense TaxID=53462 RepID=A0AAI8XME6_MYCME|nr:DeoR/GlpR family DNA-binding transcription regulator [Mycolicibacterium mageritense]MBN3456197.1 DeoR/GlpR transcriptional regulator [Mycobacterium sp. DSM 3803]OKH83213.1 DeoR family transcriptional regulator [Mycobacterium sp. SWH-M3]MCC9182935.1 DeoR/GlpR family DNA-binding transcription regulator [Mycolicibacterium mageritense]TXI58834.1 MAG: DeoR/GlpR transcriptional regulator [Mycolicibacterium mageritense]CDO22234.1 sugar metabolism transcriptional regulator [Mycolicibacterium mageri
MAIRESQARRSEIVRLARSIGLASVDELSAQFGVTASTIRRDLSQLTAQGLIARTYGGAIPLDQQPESSLRQRALEGFDAKRAIARWAADQVQPGETILLDAGTTVGAMGHFLTDVRDLVVVAAGLTVLEVLADADDIRVECIGGTMRHISQGFIGPLAEATLQRLTFDRAFLGADAVTADLGICEAELVQTRLKEIMIERADQVYVLAHAEKLGRRPFHAWAPIPPGATLVTDTAATDEQVAPFEESGIRVVRAAEMR